MEEHDKHRHNRRRRKRAKTNWDKLELRVSGNAKDIIERHDVYSLSNEAFVSLEMFDDDKYWAIFNDRIVLRLQPCSLVSKGEVVLDAYQRRSLGGIEYHDHVYLQRWNTPLDDIKCSHIWVSISFLNGNRSRTRSSLYPRNMATVEKIIETKFLGHVLTEGQALLLDISRDEQRPSTLFDVTIDEIIGGYKARGKISRGLVEKNTIIRAKNTMIRAGDKMAIRTIYTPPINKFRRDFNLSLLEAELNKCEIGGLAQPLKTILEGVFRTESLPLPYYPSLSLARRKVKGVLLYGPHYAGTYLIAHKIHWILGGIDPKIIKLEEIRSSPKDVFSLFKEAIKDYTTNRCRRLLGKKNGKRDKLHVFTIENIESLSLPDQPRVSDAIKYYGAALATLMDKLDNILVIGTTRRINLDHVWPSILRPGRFELHVKFDLPNNRQRVDMLKLFTRPLIQEKCLKEEDVDIEEIALWTYGYSYYQLSRLVRLAVVEANKRVTNYMCAEYRKETQVSMDDFYFALPRPRSIKINLAALPVEYVARLCWVLDQFRSPPPSPFVVD